MTFHNTARTRETINQVMNEKLHFLFSSGKMNNKFYTYICE